MSDQFTAHTPAERVAVAFARVLRGADLRVPLGSVLAFVDALGQVGIAVPHPVHRSAADLFYSHRHVAVAVRTGEGDDSRAEAAHAATRSIW